MRAAKATRAATLIVVTLGDRDFGNITAGRPIIETAVRCRGLVVSWIASRFLGTEVQAGDRVIHLIATTLRGSTPKIGDKIQIEGRVSRVINLDRDGAAAVWMCLTRGSELPTAVVLPDPEPAPEDSFSDGFSSGFGG